MKSKTIKPIISQGLGQKEKHLLYYYSDQNNLDNIRDHSTKLTARQKRIIKEYFDIDL